jgi:amino acid transporter
MDRVHPATAPSMEEHDADAGTVTEFGYKPVLRRSMGGFTTFAISFSLISISTGIFANYSFGLDNAGPRLLWSWVIVGVGQMVIALNLAHLAPRIPLAGYAYQWASRMRSAAFGWFPGWFALAGWLTGTAGVAYAFAAYFAPYAGWGSSQGIIVLVTAIVIIAYLAIHLVGIRFTGYVNNFSVVTELIGITAVGIGLLIYSLVRGLPNANIDFIFSHGNTAGSAGLGAFAVSALLGAYTLTGYEGAADLAEESKNPRHSIPRAIITAEAISASVGFLVLLGFTMAIPNLAAAQASSTPLLYIMQARLPSIVVELAMAMVFIAIFACGLMNLAAVSRLGFSMARDNMLPFSEHLRRVSRRFRSPYVILIVCAIISVLFTLIAKVESVITSVSSVGIFAAYFLVILAGVLDKTHPAIPGTFNLGRAYKPLAYIGMFWCVLICCAMTIPSVGNVAGEGSLVMIALGVIWYYYRARHISVETPSQTTGVLGGGGAGQAPGASK